MGRRKIDIKEVKDPSTKQVTFSKRRTGLFKKANELSILCGAEIAVIVFSPGNKPYSYGHPSVDAVANKYLKQQSDPNFAQPNDVKEDDSSNKNGKLDVLNQELADLQAQICQQEKKSADLHKKLKRFEGIQLSKHKELKGSYVEFQLKVKDFLDAVEVAEYMLLLAQEPAVGVDTKQVSKKKRKDWCMLCGVEVVWFQNWVSLP